MSEIKIILAANNSQACCYRVCGKKIIANKKLHSLSVFVDIDNHNSKHFNLEAAPTNKDGEIIFQGESWLAEKNRQIICSKTDAGYFINVPEISEFFIDFDGLKIIQISSNEPKLITNFYQFEYTLLGPPLMLALALNHCFALHASSVDIAGKAILFTGKSGLGKSTLAKHLQSEFGQKRLSDDISVLSRSSSNFVLNADFPQLKIANDSQNNQNDNCNLGAVIVLNRQMEDGELKLSKLNSINAMEVVLNHGVAVQLFDKTLANQHLKFMADLTNQTPIYELKYPTGRNKINAIAEILKSEFD